jgi:DNA invertase Pin-like site-specific DNA recombinase
MLDVTKPEDETIIRRLRMAATRQHKAIEHFRQTVREAAASGMSYRAIARAAGLSFQRVHQIVREQDS